MAEEQKVFFSYSRVDGEAFALRLATDLRKEGCNIWIDQLDIRPGKPWDLEIEKALQTATCILFIATEKSTASNNVLDEVYYALDNNKEVIPVIFGNCQIPFRLRRVQHIDFTNDYDSAFERLLQALAPGAGAEGIRAGDSVPAKSMAAGQPLVPKTQPANRKKPQAPAWLLGAGIGLLAVLVVLYFILSNKKPETGMDKSLVKADTASRKPDSPRTVTVIPDKSSRENNNGGNTLPTDTHRILKINPEILSGIKATGKYFRLQLKSSEKYLDASYCGTTVALSNHSDYATGACQLWRLVPVAGGWNELQLKNGEQYLCADNCSSDVILKPASTFDPNDGCALWRLVPAGNGWGRLQIRSGEQYLDAAYCGDKVVLNASSDYADGACQLWRLASN